MAKEIATFAGGCFWCMVKPFDSQPGIESVSQDTQAATKKIRHTRKYVAEQQGIQRPYKSRSTQKYSLMKNS